MGKILEKPYQENLKNMGSMFSLKTCSGQSSKFVSHWVRTSGRFDSRKHSHSTKLEQIPQMAVGTDFHAQHGTETILVFLPADGEASQLLLPSLVSLLSGGTVQPENIYSCILKCDRPGLRKSKDKHEHYLQLPLAFISLSQSQLIY